MRRLVILFYFFISAVSSSAQVIDSLESMLKSSDLRYEKRIDIKNELARELTFVDPLRAIQVAKEVLEATANQEYLKGKAYAYRNLASAYSNYGSFYLTIDNMQKATGIFEELHDSAGMASCMVSLGHTYRRLNNRGKELENNLNAYLVFSRLNIADRIGVTALNLGETYYLMGDLEKSLPLVEKAVRINDSLGNSSVLSACYKVLGSIYLQKNQLNEAESYYLKVLAISEKLGENSQKLATIESMINLGKLYDRQGKHDKELDILIIAAEFVRKNRQQDYVQEVYLKLIDNYLERGNEELARQAVREFEETQKVVAKAQLEDKNKLTMGFIQLFEIEKKNNELAAENQRQQERVRSRNQVILISLVFFLIMVVMVFILVNNVKKLKKTNTLLVEKDRTITIQNVRLEELNATKDKFFSVVSHDMKAPLNSLWTFTQVLEQNINALQKDQLLEMVKAARQHLEMTTKMTENLLTWAKLQMKEMKTTPSAINIEEIVKDVIAVYHEIAENKKIRLTANIPAGTVAMADKDQVYFIIRNLVNNAIKYTPPGGEVTIKAESTGKNYRISVTDTGKGINKELAEKLFTAAPITSAAGTGGEQGTGLGLKLCYEFARLNNGSLLIADRIGQGAELDLILPGVN